LFTSLAGKNRILYCARFEADHSFHATVHMYMFRCRCSFFLSLITSYTYTTPRTDKARSRALQQRQRAGSRKQEARRGTRSEKREVDKRSGQAVEVDKKWKAEPCMRMRCIYRNMHSGSADKDRKTERLKEECTNQECAPRAVFVLRKRNPKTIESQIDP